MLNEKANFLLLKTRRKKIYLYELFKKHIVCDCTKEKPMKNHRL